MYHTRTIWIFTQKSNFIYCVYIWYYQISLNIMSAIVPLAALRECFQCPVVPRTLGWDSSYTVLKQENERTNDRTNERTKERRNAWRIERVNGRTNERMIEMHNRMDQRTNDKQHEQTNTRTEIDDGRNERTGRSLRNLGMGRIDHSTFRSKFGHQSIAPTIDRFTKSIVSNNRRTDQTICLITEPRHWAWSSRLIYTNAQFNFTHIEYTSYN